MSLPWQGEQDGPARREAPEREQLFAARATGESISIGNEFAEVRVTRVETRNGSRLLIESPKSGQWVSLCPLELEALTWQETSTFSAMVGNPFSSLVTERTVGQDAGEWR